MRGQAREEAREAGGVGPKVGDGAHADHAVRVVAEDVSPIGWEVGRLRRRVSGGKTGTKSSRRSVCDVFFFSWQSRSDSALTLIRLRYREDRRQPVCLSVSPN